MDIFWNYTLKGSNASLKCFFFFFNLSVLETPRKSVYASWNFQTCDDYIIILWSGLSIWVIG